MWICLSTKLLYACYTITIFQAVSLQETFVNMHEVTHAVHPCQQSCNMLWKGLKPENKIQSLSVLLPGFSEYSHSWEEIYISLFFNKNVIKLMVISIGGA